MVHKHNHINEQKFKSENASFLESKNKTKGMKWMSSSKTKPNKFASLKYPTLELITKPFQTYSRTTKINNEHQYQVELENLGTISTRCNKRGKKGHQSLEKTT